MLLESLKFNVWELPPFIYMQRYEISPIYASNVGEKCNFSDIERHKCNLHFANNALTKIYKNLTNGERA